MSVRGAFMVVSSKHIHQVTSRSVRLINSGNGGLQVEYLPPEHSINVATGTATQVLVAMRGERSGVLLAHISISRSSLSSPQPIQLDYQISCLDINEGLGLAAVGVWVNECVNIFSVPDLVLFRKVHLGEEIIPRSVLLCDFEEISYLLCALGDGRLLHFKLNEMTLELTDKKEVSLGTQPITLLTFSSNDTTHVFAACDRPTVIYSSNKKLFYSAVDLKEVRDMCPFTSAAFPDSLAIVVEDELTIGTIHDIHKVHIRSIPQRGRVKCISYQEQSNTFASCCWKHDPLSAEESEMHFVDLLDDQSFKLISTYALDTYEYGFYIVSCSFSDDNHVYYTVGTLYFLPGMKLPTKGRILVFTVEDGRLQLIAEKETKGAVYWLNAFDGKLLAEIDEEIQLYKWVLRGDGTHELQYECGHQEGTPLCLQSRKDFIVVGGKVGKSISLLTYKDEEGLIVASGLDNIASSMSVVEILDDEIFLGAKINFNLLTVRKNNELSCLEVVGEYHLGELVRRFQHGSLVKRLPDSAVGQIPTVIFGTSSGAIGVIASLPLEQYVFLEKLQSNMRKVIKGVGGLSHEQWRSFSNKKTKSIEARNFLDGDLIESFLDLNRSKMDEISKAMNISVQELCKKVKDLTMLH